MKLVKLGVLLNIINKKEYLVDVFSNIDLVKDAFNNLQGKHSDPSSCVAMFAVEFLENGDLKFSDGKYKTLPVVETPNIVDGYVLGDGPVIFNKDGVID